MSSKISYLILAGENAARDLQAARLAGIPAQRLTEELVLGIDDEIEQYAAMDAFWDAHRVQCWDTYARFIESDVLGINIKSDRSADALPIAV